MSVTIESPKRLPAPPDCGVAPRRWTRSEYHRAAETGVFGPDERLELLDGEIIQKVTQGGIHAAVVKRTDQVLTRVFGPDHHTRPQLPLILTDESEPEPDVVVVPGGPFDYLPSHPKASDARLVVEVADTTLRFDRKQKASAYARAGIIEYWIINLLHRQLEVHRDPRGSRYRRVTIIRETESIAPAAVPHAAVRVSDLLPPVPTGDNE